MSSEITWDDISVSDILGVKGYPFFEGSKKDWWLSCSKPYTMIGFLEFINYRIDVLPNWVIEKDYPKNKEEEILACHQIREVVGNPFKSFEISEIEKYWEMEKVISFANGILESGKFADVPGISDLLEEYGCTDQEIIHHFRQEIKCVSCQDNEKCVVCKGTGWTPKPVPCNSKCWVLRLLTS